MGASRFRSPVIADEIHRLLLETAPDALFVTQRDGRIVVVNTQTENLFGYSRYEMLGQKVEMLLPQRLRRQHVKHRADFLSDPMGSRLELELYGRRKNGTEFPIDVSLTTLETGGDPLVSGSIRDITDRRRSEELVSHLAAIVEASDDAIVGESLDGTIVSWNPGAERLFGYKAEEVIGLTLSLTVPPDKIHEYERILKGVRHGKHIEHFDTIWLHKDGHPIEISVTISAVKSKTDAVIGASCIARDITRQKRAEELVSSLAAIVETSDDAIIALSLDAKITSWNSGAERLYGYKAEELVGRPLSELITGGRAEQIAKCMIKLRRGEHVEPLEITQLHKDGHPIETSITVSPVKDRNGAMIGASVSGRDITRQRRAEEALRQSDERFRLALRNAPTAVFNQDRELRYTWIYSPALAWGKQEYLGHTDAEIFGGKEAARLAAIKRKVLRTGVGARTETEITSQGETCYLDMVVEPLRDVRGTLLGLTCSATDITPTKKGLLERDRLIAELREALEEVKLLSGLLSMCASCKRITNERGDWEPLESYLQTHSQAKFSHGLCPDCLRKIYPEQYQKWEQEVTAATASDGTEHASDTSESWKRDNRTKK